MSGDMYTTSEYLKKNPTYHIGDSPWKALQIVRMLRKHKLEPQSVCEVGCGVGEILNQLSSHFPQANFDGYDISPQAIALANMHKNERIHLFCEDFLEVNLKPHDLLLCIDVFEHVPDHLGFLKKLRTKGKCFVFHIPLDLSVNGLLRGLLIKSRENLGHIHYFTKETALATLSDAGYEIVDWFYTAGGLELPKSFKARLAILPRRLLGLINLDVTARTLGGYSLLVLANSEGSE